MIDSDLAGLDLAGLDLFGFLPRYCKRKVRPGGSGKCPCLWIFPFYFTLPPVKVSGCRFPLDICSHISNYSRMSYFNIPGSVSSHVRRVITSVPVRFPHIPNELSAETIDGSVAGRRIISPTVRFADPPVHVVEIGRMIP